jgi:hypothetical protein
MRLINTKTLQLEEFFGDQIPEYAILSHTWGTPKDEVSFKDIDSNILSHKAGYQKIRYLCEQASKDQLSWAWSDTCCINKDSSAELSEAINSMFQWYQHAKICYAYLSDVPSTGKHDTVGVSKPEIPPQFHTSRWFRRGWTLQELLAPEDVIFFAEDWTCIGRKQPLHNLIRDITGINRGALQWPWTISGYSVATRISWAARRKTSRPEDRAYSLLGILGVHMPLIYGEGQNAFQRLQTELIKLSDDESLFAHSGPNILAENPEAFIFDTEPYSIATALPRSTQNKPYSITNMGLSIEIPLLPHLKRDGYHSIFLGILNCHHAQDYRHYLAVPLQETSLLGTLLRAPGPVQLIEESLVKKAEKTSVLIKFRPLQTSKITCLQKSRGLLPGVYTKSLFVFMGAVPWQFREDRFTLHLNPKRKVDYEIAVHTYTGKSKYESFLVSIIFELSEDNAGLLISTPLEHVTLCCQGPDVIFAVWKGKGKPIKEGLEITGQNGQSKRVEAKIERELRLNQPMWVLSLEMTPLFPAPVHEAS